MKEPGTKRLKPKYDETFSNFAVKFYLRRYTEAYGFVASTMLQGTAEAAAAEAADAALVTTSSDANSQLQDLRSALGEERQVLDSQLVYG